jgi:hypothetical protein
MRNVGDIFALWPTDADLGRDLGVPYPTVSAWKQRGSIPPGYWRAIIRAARRRGHRQVTAEMLLDAHTQISREQIAGGSFEEGDAQPLLKPEHEVQRRGEEATGSGVGHFSRHKHIRRDRFRTAEEIQDHIRALRDEWNHR